MMRAGGSSSTGSDTSRAPPSGTAAAFALAALLASLGGACEGGGRETVERTRRAASPHPRKWVYAVRVPSVPGGAAEWLDGRAATCGGAFRLTAEGTAFEGAHLVVRVEAADMASRALALTRATLESEDEQGVRRSLPDLVVQGGRPDAATPSSANPPGAAVVPLSLSAPVWDWPEPPLRLHLGVHGVLADGSEVPCFVSLQRSRKAVPPDCDVEVSVSLSAVEECRLKSVAARCASHLDACIARCLASGVGHSLGGGCFHFCSIPHGPWDAEPEGWEECGDE